MLLSPTEREFVWLLDAFLFRNPMLSEDEASVRRLLEFRVEETPAEDSLTRLRGPKELPELDLLTVKLEGFLATLRERLRAGAVDPSAEELRTYGYLLAGSLFYRWFAGLQLIQLAGDGTRPMRVYREFAAQCEHWNDIPFELEPYFRDPAHMFAVNCQLRRTYIQVVQLIQGNSSPVRRLRGEIWESIFPHELRMYGTLLYSRMSDVPTLILGPSGTGKELVATAIGLSRYIRFDPKSLKFVQPFSGAFHAINLSAMPRDLIESEMFGHVKGAFTGATQDRQGWFEKCAIGHTVFLDEIGELEPAVQVKLLRVLQTREFYRVGEAEPRRFDGRVLAATNRDMSTEIDAGRFREDLFYRLCANIIRTPSLRDQLDDAPDDLGFLLQIIAARFLGADATEEQVAWLTGLCLEQIETSPDLGRLYPWPGNFRELEQCVRSILVRGRYVPLRRARALSRTSVETESSSPKPAVMVTGRGAESVTPALDSFVARLRAGTLTYDEVLEHYCSLIFARSEHLTDAARKLQKHRATVHARVVDTLVQEFRNS